MKHAICATLFAVVTSSPLLSNISIQSNSDLGVIEVISEPHIEFDPNTGQAIKDKWGLPKETWDVQQTIQDERELTLPTEGTIWLHAVPVGGSQFIGWVGVENSLTNPLEVSIPEVSSITAQFKSLSDIRIKTNNDLGVVELITEPQPEEDPDTGKLIKDKWGYPKYSWNVRMTIQSEQELSLPQEDTIWLHTMTGFGNQFIGWEGIEDRLANPVQVSLSQVHAITANFEAIPEINKYSPYVTGWFWSKDMGGWIYTTEELFPYIWSQTEQKWWRYEKTENGKRYFTVYGENSTVETILFEE